jgi:hypothetical protein
MYDQFQRRALWVVRTGRVVIRLRLSYAPKQGAERWRIISSAISGGTKVARVEDTHTPIGRGRLGMVG